MAKCFHRLGMVAGHRGVATHDRDTLDEAEKWHRESLAAYEMLGCQSGIAMNYHALGLVAQARGALDEAEEWHRKSLAINKELANQPNMATDYRQLGTVAYIRGALDEAARWCLKSLAIEEEIDDRPGMAKSHHKLGAVAHVLGAFDDAEQRYRKSLAITEELGDRIGMVVNCNQLGLLAEARDDLPTALEWAVRNVTIFEPFPYLIAESWCLARLTGLLGLPALEAAWRKVTGKALPAEVRAWVEAHRDDPDVPNGA